MKVYGISKKTVLLTTATVLTMALAIGAVTGLISLLHAPDTNMSNAPSKPMGQMPLVFVKNQGQWDDRVAFMCRKPGMTAWLQKDMVTYKFEKQDHDARVKGDVISMAFEGASEQVEISGEEEQSADHNFFIGNDRSKWRSNVIGYAKAIYHNLYPGIDLCFRDDKGWLEYDLALSHGADLSDVVIRCEGLKDLWIDETGDLVMETEYGPITQTPPKAWYKLPSGENLSVECRFCRIDDNSYGFCVPECDLELAMVIDPGLEWSTYLGGSADDNCISLDLTATGNVITAGATESADFPITPGAYDTTFIGGTNDGCISCISADGSQLLWSTFLGGNATDVLFEVALDDSDRVIVAGLTESANFPTTPGAYDTTYNGGIYDGIVSCLNPDGSQLLYSTYLGTSAEDMIVALDVAESEEAVVCGYTGSTNFPTTSGAYDTTYNGGVRDAFVTRLSADGTALVYSTYLGGNNDDGSNYQYPIIVNTDMMILLLDTLENVIVCGSTRSTNFPTTPGAYDQTWNGGYWDIFVTKFNATCSNLIFSTYIGGSSWEGSFLNAMCLGENGSVAIAGATASPNFPTTPGAFDTTYNGGVGDWDGYIAVLDPTGSQLLYSTYMGGTDTITGDVVCTIVFNAGGNILLAGQAEDGFPTTPGAYDRIIDDYFDAFVALLSPDGNGQSDLVYSSYIGGFDTTAMEGALDLAMIDDSTVVLVGDGGRNFPTTPSAYDPSFNGGWDGFVLRFGAYVGIQEQSATKPQSSILLSPVYPNPARGRISYEVILAQAARVKISLFDITGRFAETVMDKQLSMGVHDFNWTPKQDLANGIYYLQIDADGKQLSRKFIIMK